MDDSRIPFNRLHTTGKELGYLAEAHAQGHLTGNGPFAKRCHTWLEQRSGCEKALLTHSCTVALELAALLLDLQPGDEVIMPSYTFVSTANAFVLRGAVPVFVDVREDTLNLNETLIEAAITERTRAIVPVHYAGVGCEMDQIMAIAQTHHLKVVEDAAQGMMASYKGRPLGSIGDIGTYSFHETKNVISGEGGCLLVNDSALSHRAEIICEKGTDRSRFLRGEIDKYTWKKVGSSFFPGELIAAFLWAQLEEAEQITEQRLMSWQRYHEQLAQLEEEGLIRRPTVPEHCQHNAHIYYVLLAPGIDRQLILETFRRNNIWPASHYVPLHWSPAGQSYGRVHGRMNVTDSILERLIRLPLWIGLTENQQERVVDVLKKALSLSR